MFLDVSRVLLASNRVLRRFRWLEIGEPRMKLRSLPTRESQGVRCLMFCQFQEVKNRSFYGYIIWTRLERVISRFKLHFRSYM